MLARINNDVNAWIRAHPLIAIAVSLLTIVVLFYSYYRLVAVPAQLREKEELQVRAIAELKIVDAARQTSLDTCLAAAKSDADHAGISNAGFVGEAPDVHYPAAWWRVSGAKKVRDATPA